MTYPVKKITGRCVYASCVEPCQDDHLLCETHAKRHRLRNSFHMRLARRRRKWRREQMRLWR